MTVDNAKRAKLLTKLLGASHQLDVTRDAREGVTHLRLDGLVRGVLDAEIEEFNGDLLADELERMLC